MTKQFAVVILVSFPLSHASGRQLCIRKSWRIILQIDVNYYFIDLILSLKYLHDFLIKYYKIRTIFEICNGWTHAQNKYNLHFDFDLS